MEHSKGYLGKDYLGDGRALTQVVTYLCRNFFRGVASPVVPTSLRKAGVTADSPASPCKSSLGRFRQNSLGKERSLVQASPSLLWYVRGWEFPRLPLLPPSLNAPRTQVDSLSYTVSVGMSTSSDPSLRGKPVIFQVLSCQF